MPVSVLGRMLPLIILIAIIIVLIAIIIIVKSRKTKKKNGSNLDYDNKRINKSRDSELEILSDEIINEEDITLSIEEVPLDNRFGSSNLISSHEFTKTTTTALNFDESNELAKGITIGLKSILEAEAKTHLAQNLGIEIGSQISRKVSLTFEAEPGKFIYYKVVWKQNIRKGIIKIRIKNTIVELPYNVMYGLHHSVESVLTDKNK